MGQLNWKKLKEVFDDRLTLPVGCMTVRDYFAGQALVGLLIGEQVEAFRKNEFMGDGVNFTPAPFGKELAHVAYAQADHMMRAREDNGEHP